MLGLTNYVTEKLWEDILTATFLLIDDECLKIGNKYFPNRKFAPKQGKFSHDSEVITITLFGEMIFDGDEDKTLHFIRQYHPNMFPYLLDNGRFNRRRRALSEQMEDIRCRLRDTWYASNPLDEEEESLRLVDSAPVPICTYTRGARCQSIPLDQRDNWFGVCIKQEEQVFWSSLSCDGYARSND